MNEQETIIERIQKLLTKAERTDNPAEAEAFFAKAAALQSKHAIDEIMLNAAAGKKRDDIITKEFPFTGGYARANIMMLDALGKVLNCRVIIVTNWSSNKSKAETGRVHGFRSDIERLEILFSSLMIQATRQLKPWAKEHTYSHQTAAQKYQARKSFLIGFGLGAAQKLKEAMTEVVDSTPGSGLVLVDRKDQVDRHVDDSYGKLGTTSTKRDYAAEGHGRRAGRNADLGQRGVGGTQRGLGS